MNITCRRDLAHHVRNTVGGDRRCTTQISSSSGVYSAGANFSMTAIVLKWHESLKLVSSNRVQLALFSSYILL